MLDRWLDDFEARWQAGAETPCLAEFWQAAEPGDSAEHALAELAMIDLEMRWRRFYRAPSQITPAAFSPAAEAFPLLPLWKDYVGRFAALDASRLTGICHEFRVRQAFGDQPDSRDFLANYGDDARELAPRLAEIAAELTRATLSVFVTGRPTIACRLPGRVEIGRRRVGEPCAPCLLAGPADQRLLIADLTAVRISRTQLWLETISLGRVLLRKIAPKGRVIVNTTERLAPNQEIVVELPCIVELSGVALKIE